MFGEKINNLYDLFEKYGDDKLLITALIRYTLPALGFPESTGKKITQKEKLDALDFMKLVSISEVKNLVKYQNQVFEKLGNPNSKRTYRMVLKRFVERCKPDLRETGSGSSSTVYLEPPDRCPPMRFGRPHIKKLRVTNRELTPSSPDWYYSLNDAALDEQTKACVISYFQNKAENPDRLFLEFSQYFKGCAQSPELTGVLNQLLLDSEVELSVKNSVQWFLEGHEISPPLQQQLEDFYNFMVDAASYRKRQDQPLRPRSAKGNLDSAKRYLGYLFRFKGISLDRLNLSLLVSSSGLTPERQRDEAGIDCVLDQLEEYLRWHERERKSSPDTQLKVVTGTVAVAKFLYHKQSNSRFYQEQTWKRVGYRDIPIIEELRVIECAIQQRVKTATPVADESKKWVDWPIFKACVERLWQECALRDQGYKKRTDHAVATSYQVFLIVLIFSAFPDRARTIYELELGKTFVKQNDQYLIVHSPIDFKTGSSFCRNGEKRVVPLPKEFTLFIDRWFDRWRPVFCPRHQRVFTMVRTGNPLGEGNLYSYFRTRIYRLTGQLMTPHQVRDSIVTHFALSGEPEAVMQALADLMAHSRKTQHKIYDRRTSQQKIIPAIEAILKTPTGDLKLKPEQDTGDLLGLE